MASKCGECRRARGHSMMCSIGLYKAKPKPKPPTIYTQADLDAAIQNERERCAQRLDRMAKSIVMVSARNVVRDCASAIRQEQITNLTKETKTNDQR